MKKNTFFYFFLNNNHWQLLFSKYNKYPTDFKIKAK